MKSGDWLLGIRVENTVRITCVLNAFSMRIQQEQKRGRRVIIHLYLMNIDVILLLCTHFWP